jgi:hypothetical protein
MRNDNFVYEEELFYISCAETINGKNPYLMVDYREADFKDDDDEQYVDAKRGGGDGLAVRGGGA